MFDIADSLTDEDMERLRLGPGCDEKLLELQGIAEGCCIFEDLGQVIELWDEDEEGEDEDERSSDGNEEEEEDEDERFVAGMLPRRHLEIL